MDGRGTEGTDGTVMPMSLWRVIYRPVAMRASPPAPLENRLARCAKFNQPIAASRFRLSLSLSCFLPDRNARDCR